MATGQSRPKPRPAKINDPSLAAAHRQVKELMHGQTVNPANEDWIALRLLEGDLSMEAALRDGTLGQLSEDHAGTLIGKSLEAPREAAQHRCRGANPRN